MRPTLHTPRLILNRLELSDVPEVTLYAGNPKVAATTAHIPHPYTEDDAKEWIERTHIANEQGKAYAFAIRLKSDSKLIGAIGIHADTVNNKAEFGYWLTEKLWSQGIVTEAAAALLKFGFEELKLNRIYATHMAHNPASGKIMIKNNMIFEGTIKDFFFKNGEYITVNQYRLTREEYFKLQE